jgi:hypothetical protein
MRLQFIQATWSLSDFSPTSTGQGLALQRVVLSDNHPAHATDTQIFTIVYDTEKSLFATATTSYFQPMLQSFKFT